MSKAGWSTFCIKCQDFGLDLLMGRPYTHIFDFRIFYYMRILSASAIRGVPYGVPYGTRPIRSIL